LKIIELLEIEESETINREVETRKSRLNAGTLPEIKSKVLKEVYSDSEVS
jgi:hypothetical protein